MLTDLTTFVVPIDFACTIVNENLILSNVYQIKLAIDPNDSSDKIGIGFQRIRHLVDNCFQNSVLVNQSNKLAKEFSEIENNVVYLPCEPYDLYVGSIILSKLLAVTNEYFDIQYLTVASAVGDSVQYTVHSPFDCGLDIEGEHWWNSDTVSTGHKTVVTWDELNLIPAPAFQPTLVQGGLSGSK
jgi:hypothetical protein